jgi:putative ABC transport system permease protein
LSQDLRYAIRSLSRTPGFSLVVILILAVSIGANTVIFSLVDSVLLKPLPYPESERLVMIWDHNTEQLKDHEGPAPGNVLDWRARNKVFTGVGAWREESLALITDVDAEEIPAARVTVDFFPVLGTKALHGRTFRPEEVETQAKSVVISHWLWASRFGSDPSVVGRKITLAGESYEVIGVMPAEFAVPSTEIGLWRPWNFNLGYAHLGSPPRDFRFLFVVARLAPGVSVERAEEDMKGLAAQLAQDFPEENAGWTVEVVPLQEELVGQSRQAILVLFGAVGFVLLIACANIAALMLVRALGRRQETAIRLVLGASRFHLIRQFLIQSVLLGLLGGALGAVLAYAGLDLLLSIQSGEIPRAEEIAIDGRILAFTFLVSLVAGILFGLAPALQSVRTRLTDSLKGGGGRGGTTGRAARRLRNALAVAEVAVALVLLIGAGLLIRSFVRLQSVDPGFNPENVLTMRISLRSDVYGDGGAVPYYEQLVERIEALPGVVSAAAVTGLPMNLKTIDFERPYWHEGTPQPESNGPVVSIRIATPDYFKTLGMTLLRGRDFTPQDREETQPVLVVNETAAQTIWPGQDPLGKRLVVDYRGVYTYEVVGVVRDTRFYGLRGGIKPEVFTPHAQVPYLPMSVVVRTAVEPMTLAQQVREVARGLNRAQPVYEVTTMEKLVSRSVARDRLSTSLLGVLALVALLLAALGIYGLLAYGVRQRTQEIGVRLALGARRSTVLGLIVGESLKLTLLGTVIGLFLAVGLTRLMASLLFGIEPTDLTTFAGVSLLLVATALLAGYLPARRATQVDPVVALREG